MHGNERPNHSVEPIASQAEAVEEFADVREIQRRLKAEGLALMMEADESAAGPGSLMLTDPDGNPILIDQHVDSPKDLKSRLAQNKYDQFRLTLNAEPI